MSTEEYKQLADMKNRGTCPRCEGFGFIHASKEKHDKPTHTRCKKCIDCSVCDSSGVTLGVIKCARCSAKGFYHSPKAPKPHILSEYVKCFDCIICVDCQGQCVINSQRFEELKKVQIQKLEAKNESINPAAIKPGMLMMPPRMPDNVCFVGGKLPPLSVIDPEKIHPHMAGIIGIPITERVVEIINSITKDLDVKTAKPVQSVCPRCLGAGYRHDSSSKHDKKANEKCKLCTPCCKASGVIAGNKRACTYCETRGFVHNSAERDHDVPANLRCFFCKDCIVCRGTGIESLSTHAHRHSKRITKVM